MCAVAITTVFKNNLPANSLLKVIVSPNPFNSTLQISLTPELYSYINIQVYNTLGAVVKTSNPPLNSNNFEYDFSDLTSGVYFIKVATSQGTVVKRVIKQ